MLKYSILFLLFYSCENITAPKIEQDSGGYESQNQYLINLEGLNTGNYFDVCTLKWTQYSNEDFQSYRLRNKDEIIANINQAQDTVFIRELTPGMFEKLYVDVISETTMTDSIEIYTRPIKSITNLSAVANAENWFSTLNWTPSEEISTKFDKYSIYRSEINMDNFILIDEITSQLDSSYIDEITTWGYEYYYKIETHTSEGYSRFSIVQSNITNNIETNDINVSATNNQHNKINLSWEHDLNNQTFYAIEIWRTNNQSSDPINDYLLATITDYNQSMLEDSYVIGNGISWFYKLKLIDQFGNINYSSIVSGNALP